MLSNSLPWVLGSLMLVVALVALRKPVKWLGRLLGRTGIGLGVLYGLSYVGAFVGINLGVNLMNALVLGVLGAPGLGLLMMLHWALR